jgi:hypothetical protein
MQKQKVNFRGPILFKEESLSLLVLTYLNAVTGISVGHYLIYADTAQNFNPQLQGALLRIFIKPIFQPRISFSVYSNPYTFPHHRFMVRKFSYN